MGTIRSFRDLEAWQAAMDLVMTTYAIVKELPAAERFELGAQLRRAAVSVPSNIAEGNACGPRRRYLNHLRIAIGSLAELDTQLDIATRLQFLPPSGTVRAQQQVNTTARLLHGLVRSLRMPRYEASCASSRNPPVP
jgi:four helix bundle protein